ncbi:MAG: TRAP transporter large permease subunit [Aquamicrobium sp.]|nr:TRAP transporter large permease subunit [Aquamicrobium sp.]
MIFAIGFAGMAYFFIKPGMSGMLDIYAHKFFTGMDVFIWLSIPLFIIAGEIMTAIGMTDRLVNLSRLMVGRLRGGLAYVNVVGSMMFSGVSGSALADISALGPIEVKMMEKDGYRKDFSAALTVASAIQGPIIPPSIPLIIFSALTNTSVAALFLAGAVPGHDAGHRADGRHLLSGAQERFSAQPHREPHAGRCLPHLHERVLGDLHAADHSGRHHLRHLHGNRSGGRCGGLCAAGGRACLSQPVAQGLLGHHRPRRAHLRLRLSDRRLRNHHKLGAGQ